MFRYSEQELVTDADSQTFPHKINPLTGSLHNVSCLFGFIFSSSHFPSSLPPTAPLSLGTGSQEVSGRARLFQD